jgi:hypothetical protein
MVYVPDLVGVAPCSTRHAPCVSRVSRVSVVAVPRGVFPARVQVPFIDEMLDGLAAITQDLELGQVHSVYESMGHIVQAQAEPQARLVLLNKLMLIPNQYWTAIIGQASADLATVYDPKTVKMTASMLKTNHRVALAVGSSYIVQLSRIYTEMLQLYKMYSEFISNEVATKGFVSFSLFRIRISRRDIGGGFQ